MDQWIKDLSKRTDTLKLIEKKVDNIFAFIGTEEDVLNGAPIVQALRPVISE